MNNTISTKIKDFNVNDLFIHYGAKFKVISEVREWTGHRGTNDRETTYGRECKFIELIDKPNSCEGILKDYDYMQGSEVVTYAKII